MLSSQNGHELVARDLIKAGADLEKQTAKGSTALMLAAQNNHDRVARALLENGADIPLWLLSLAAK